MGDDRGGPTGGRAPWERSGQGPGRHQPPPARQPVTPPWHDNPQSSPPPYRPAPPPPPRDTSQISVRELVERVERDSGQVAYRDPRRPVGKIPPRRGEIDSPTEELPKAPPRPPTATRPAPDTGPKNTGPQQIPASDPEAKAPTRLAALKLRRQRRLRIAGRSATASVAALMLVLTGAGWTYQHQKNGNFTHVNALDLDSPDVIDAAAQADEENYLLVGSDSRVGANGKIGAGTEADAEGVRADTVMLVNIPKDRKRVVAVSFPRDLDVSHPACKPWDPKKPTEYGPATNPAADNAKLNSVYAVGGPQCLLRTIQKITGAQIRRFVAIDFSGFEAMVQQVGGVEVCAEKPLIDEELGRVLATPGKQRVDGKTALNYVRARKVAAEGNGDYGRIKRQQRFLSSLLRQSLSSDVLTSPGKLNGFIDAFTKATMQDNVTTTDLVNLGRSMQKLDAGAVTFLTVPTDGTTQWGNEIPRTSAINALFTAIRNGQPLPGEQRTATSTTPAKPATPQPPVAVSPANISVKVLNGADITGAATTVSNQLRRYGFSIPLIDGYPDGSATTVVRYGPGQQNAAATVASTIAGAQIVETPGLGSTVELILGTNYPGKVTAPTPPGQQVVLKPAAAAPTTLPSDLEHVNAAEDICK